MPSFVLQNGQVECNKIDDFNHTMSIYQLHELYGINIIEYDDLSAKYVFIIFLTFLDTIRS